MKKLFTRISLAVLVLSTNHIFGQVSLFTANGTYSQNFDGMGQTTTYPTGWTGIRYAGSGTANATLTPAVDNGNGSSGNTYNVGSSSASDRALGTLASGSTAPAFGASFVNNTTSAITSFQISAYSEQWRTGSSSSQNETIIFEYSTDATSLSSGTWTAVSSLNLVELQTSSTSAGAIDGNASGNRVAITGSISSLNIPVNGTIWIRWRDLDNTGSDGMYAVDDLVMNYTNQASSSGGTVAVSAGNNAAEPSTNGTFNVILSAAAPAGGVTVTYTLSGTASGGQDYSDPQSGTITIPQGSTSGVITLNVIDDTTPEPTETITVTLASANNNYTISTTSTATINLFDNDGAVGTTYSFNNCGSSVTDGFTQYSVTGAEAWACTTFGRNASDSTLNSPYGVQMNGFNSGNQNNEDWFISPKMNLSGTNIPLLKFWSRNKFTGPQLQLKVSTNYSGSGNPNAATWTTINGKFPAENSDVWTLSDSINLSAFKTADTYVAWVYTSTTASAARWSLDDITFFNSTVAPSPYLSVYGTLLDFREIAFGSSSYAKSFTFSASELTASLTVTAPAGFQLSKDTTAGYSSSLTYTSSEVQTGIKTVYVRFTPTAANAVFSGNVQFTSAGINQQRIFLKGNSYSLSSMLNIVNWNIEWFGSPSNGPSDDQLQQDNAKKVIDYLGADAYGVAEITDATRFSNLVSSLSGGYSYVIGNYCSGGTSLSSCGSAQKMAFIYKTSEFSNVTSRGLMLSSSTATSNWASGRVPFLVNADVTKNGVTRNINFIVLHAKANTGTSAEQIDAYNRRKAGVQELKDTLDTYFSTANIIMIGDYNDDLDRTIAPTTGADTVSSYQPVVADSTDANSYRSLTLPLSYFKLSSTASNPEMIDHVVVSNEVAPMYINLSATLYNDIDVLAGITNYFTTTSDHYPVRTSYRLSIPSAITDYFRTKQSGNWNDVATWESSPDGTTWSAATATPDFNANTINILNGHAVTVTANLTIDQTTINSGGAVIVNPGIVLTINDGTGTDLTITDLAGLLVKSTVAGNGSIGTSAGTISGSIGVERYISDKRAWRLLGIPYSSSTVTIKQSWMESLTGATTMYGTHITTYSGDPNAANFDAQKPASSIRTYAADNFNSDAAHTPNTTTNIAANQAYFLFVRGDRSIDLNNTSAHSSTTLRTYGTPNSGNVTKGITGTSFSLIPNPYPSNLDFDAIKAIPANSSITTFYVWDATLGTVGQYRTVQITGAGPNYTYTATPGTASNNWRFIESGTAFFVPGNRTVDFTEATKTSGTPPSSMLRVTTGNQPQLIVNLYAVKNNTATLADGVREVFDNMYSNAVDNDDAKKIAGFDVNLGIANKSDILSVEKRPLPSEGDVIALNIANISAGNYRFEVQSSNFPSNITSAFIKDNYLNLLIPFSVTGNTKIDFSITSDAASFAANRFSIVFTKGAAVNAYPSIVVYPNPVQNGVITLQMAGMPKGLYSVRLINALGQTVITKQINHAEGVNIESINVNKIKGNCILEIINPDNTKQSNKIVIN